VVTVGRSVAEVTTESSWEMLRTSNGLSVDLLGPGIRFSDMTRVWALEHPLI
jgi:hypothetical protein